MLNFFNEEKYIELFKEKNIIWKKILKKLKK